MLRRSLLCCALLACSAGDGEPAPPAPSTDTTSICPTGFLGNPAAEPTLELRALRADGTDVALASGGDLAIVTPPQGGRVAFVGVRAKNLDGCGVRIFATLRDPTSKQARTSAITVNLQRAADGFGTSGAAVSDIRDYRELGSYAHIALCPNAWAGQDAFDAPFDVDVRVVDREGRNAARALRITPRCSEAGARGIACRCLCTKGYVAGAPCAP